MTPPADGRPHRGVGVSGGALASAFVRGSGIRVAAVLLAALLCLVGAAPVSAVAAAAAQEPEGAAQQDGESDPLGSERRLIDRASSERVDSVVIALFFIAGGMTVMLAIFLWHTSPRRRLRLARRRSKPLYVPAGGELDSGDSGSGEAEPETDDPAADESESEHGREAEERTV